jgi:hypothetical protein
MICEASQAGPAACPHCRVAATLDADSRLRWEAWSLASAQAPASVTADEMVLRAQLWEAVARPKAPLFLPRNLWRRLFQ